VVDGRDLQRAGAAAGRRVAARGGRERDDDRSEDESAHGALSFPVPSRTVVGRLGGGSEIPCPRRRRETGRAEKSRKRRRASCGTLQFTPLRLQDVQFSALDIVVRLPRSPSGRMRAVAAVAGVKAAGFYP